MPILDLQKRARELGRIRIGQVQPTSTGRTRPAKLDRFRITANSRELIEKIAALYGGTAREWTPQGGGPVGWEVITDSTRLPILVPPQPISQFLEHWSGGGCARRCDGVRELLTDQPCICGPDPEQRLCKPTTRLNVILREVEGIGVFRLESHGWYAASELPMAAELLAAAGSYIQGFLGLEERVVKRAGKTNRFMVPTIDIAITPEQLMSGGAASALGGGQAQQLEQQPARAALPTGPSNGAAPPSTSRTMTADQQEVLLAQIADIPSLAALTEMSRGIAAEFDIDPAGPIPAAFRMRAQQLQQQPAAEVTAAPTADPAGDADAAWLQVLQAVPQEWTSEQVEQQFAAWSGTPAEQASAAEMLRYVEHLRAGGA